MEDSGAWGEMPSYIGVKIVKAWPTEKNGKPGYKVVYPDGYESWSPKEVFEGAYLPLEDPRKITAGVVDRFLGPVEVSKLDPKTTLVKAKTATGFVSYEVSSCVDPANYNEDIGKEVATNRIKDTLWLCLGFVLQWGKCGLKAA